MDAWIRHHQQQAYDHQGQWAMTGQLDTNLLSALLSHPFFQQKGPRSTGHEDFHLAWLQSLLPTTIAPENVQRTLLELTAHSIADAAQHQLPRPAQQLWVTGGGALNLALIERLKTLMPNCSVASSQQAGINPQWVEALLFAWLAHQRINNISLDCRAITGTTKPGLLGVIFPA